MQRVLPDSQIAVWPNVFTYSIPTVVISTVAAYYLYQLCRSGSKSETNYKLPWYMLLELAITTTVLQSGNVITRPIISLLHRNSFLHGLTSRHQILYKVHNADSVLAKPHHLVNPDPIALALFPTFFGVSVPPELRKDFTAFYKALTTAVERGFVNETASNIAIQEAHIPTRIFSLLSFSENPKYQHGWEKNANVRIYSDCVEVDLDAVLKDFGGHTSIPMLYGQDFLKRHPTLLDDFWLFDAFALPFKALGIPEWVPIRPYQKALAARCRLQDALIGLYRRIDQYENGTPIDYDAKMGDIGQVAIDRHRLFVQYNIPISDRGKFELGTLWAQNANTQPLIFWFIFFVYSTPGLVEELRNEVCGFLPPLTGSNQIDDDSIDLAGLRNKCPLLKSVFLETFRVVSQPTSMRYMSEPMSVFDGQHHRHLQPGTWISVPHWGTQQDPSVFENPTSFQPRRFIKRDEKTGNASVGYGRLKPWGVGAGMCKGRVLAEKQVLATVACCIMMWDIEPVKPGWVESTWDDSNHSGNAALAWCPRKNET
ncbi:hypothetical protein V2G26_000097 [Clonostachys chloroleuca]